jgi:hypothetical protein
VGLMLGSELGSLLGFELGSDDGRLIGLPIG